MQIYIGAALVGCVLSAAPDGFGLGPNAFKCTSIPTGVCMCESQQTHPVFNFDQPGHVPHHVSVCYPGVPPKQSAIPIQTLGQWLWDPITEKARRPKKFQNLPSHCSPAYPAVEHGASPGRLQIGQVHQGSPTCRMSQPRPLVKIKRTTRRSYRFSSVRPNLHPTLVTSPRAKVANALCCALSCRWERKVVKSGCDARSKESVKRLD